MTSRASRVTGLCSVCIKVSEVELLTVLDQVDNKTHEIEELRARHLKSDGHLLAENARLKAQLDQAHSYVEQLRLESERLRKERDMLSARKTRRKRKSSKDVHKIVASTSQEAEVPAATQAESAPENGMDETKVGAATQIASEIPDEVPVQDPIPWIESEYCSVLVWDTWTVIVHETAPLSPLPEFTCLIECVLIVVFPVHPIPPEEATYLWEENSTTFAVEVRTPPLLFTIVVEQWRIDVQPIFPPAGEVEGTHAEWDCWYVQVWVAVHTEPFIMFGLLECFTLLVHPSVCVPPGEAILIYDTWTVVVHPYVSPDFAEARCILEYYSQDLVLPVPIAPLLGEQTWDCYRLVLFDLVRTEADLAEQLWDCFSFQLVFPVCIDPTFAVQIWESCGLTLLDIVRTEAAIAQQLWDCFAFQLVFSFAIDPVFAVQEWDSYILILEDIMRIEPLAGEQLVEIFGFQLVFQFPISPEFAEQHWDSSSVQVFPSVAPSWTEVTGLLETHSILVYPVVPVDPLEGLCIYECFSLLLLDLVRVETLVAELVLEQWSILLEKQVSTESLEYTAIYETWSIVVVIHVPIHGIVAEAVWDAWSINISASESPKFAEALCVLETWSFIIIKHVAVSPHELMLLLECCFIKIHDIVAPNPLEEVFESLLDTFKISKEEFEEYIRLDAQLKSKGDTTTNKKIAMAKLKLEQANKPVESELERVFRKRDRKYEAFEATSGAVTGKEEGEFGTNDIKKIDIEAPVRRSTLPVANKLDQPDEAKRLATAAGILKPKKELPEDADDFEKINHFLGKADSTVSTLDTTAITDDGSETTPKTPKAQVEPKKDVKKPAEISPSKKPAVTAKTNTPAPATSTTKTGTAATSAKGVTDTRTASKTVVSPVKPVAAKQADAKDSPAARKPALDTGIKKPATTLTPPAKPATASPTKPGTTTTTAKTPVPVPPKKPVPGAPAPPPRPTGSAQTKKIEEEDLLDGDELLNGFLNETKASGFEASGIPAPKKPEPVPPTKPAPVVVVPKKMDIDEDDFMNEFIEDTKSLTVPETAKKTVEKTGDDLLDEFLEMEEEEPTPTDEAALFAAKFMQGNSAGGTRGASTNQGTPQIPTAAFGRLTSRR